MSLFFFSIMYAILVNFIHYKKLIYLFYLVNHDFIIYFAYLFIEFLGMQIARTHTIYMWIWYNTWWTYVVSTPLEV